MYAHLLFVVVNVWVPLCALRVVAPPQDISGLSG